MEAFIQALKDENAALQRQATELRAQNKEDEAVFCTVRANVYDIGATVCAVHAGKGDLGAFDAFLTKLQTGWTAALENAKREGDAKKICVEETKLEALADVRARFDAARCR